MIRWAIVDANEVVSAQWKGVVASVIGSWLVWELGQAKVERVLPDDSPDVILLTHVSAVGWRSAVRATLRAKSVIPDRSERSERPIIITGGAVATMSATALQVVDYVIAGEGYGLLRQMLACESVQGLRDLLSAADNVIRPEDVGAFSDKMPYLRAAPPTRAIKPDWDVDWSVPAFQSNDRVIRYLVSKGCHMKCAFCATSYSQPYSECGPEHGARILASMSKAARQGRRAQFISNDPARLPWYHLSKTHITSGSFTIHELRDPSAMRAIRRTRPRIVRLGVEGLSQRIRRAFGKRISDDEVVDICARLSSARISWHLFFIVGAPFETGDDWEEFRSLFRRLRDQTRWGINRIKMTSFMPNPPAPLATFRPALDMREHYDAFIRWMLNDCVSSHCLILGPRRTSNRAYDIIEALDAPHLRPVVRDLMRESKDWASAISAIFPERFDQHYERLPWELVRWPLPQTARRKVGEVYARKMQATPSGQLTG